MGVLKCNDSDDAYFIANDICQLANRYIEMAFVIALDADKTVIGIFEISRGTRYSVDITPKDVFKRLCIVGADSFVLLHNHIDGNLAPSDEDVEATRRLQRAGFIMGIHMVDHLILGNGYYSFMRDNSAFNGGESGYK